MYLFYALQYALRLFRLLMVAGDGRMRVRVCSLMSLLVFGHGVLR